jgi:hypothetical protein
VIFLFVIGVALWLAGKRMRRRSEVIVISPLDDEVREAVMQALRDQASDVLTLARHPQFIRTLNEIQDLPEDDGWATEKSL